MDLRARPAWRSRVWLAAFGVLAAMVLVLATLGLDDPASAAVVLVSSAVAAAAVIGWALGRTRRQRRAYEESLTAWAAERATQRERLRIARELHDLASHGLGLITVRAAAARSVGGPAAEAERASALADIEDAGRAATAELRRMLTVLRSPAPAGGPGDPDPLRPTVMLTDLPAIVANAHRSVPEIAVEVGNLGDVPGGLQSAVGAIVGEALANVARHAGPAPTRLRVVRDGEQLLVEVVNDGPVPGWVPHPGAGHGLLGMRERATVLGGSLTAGPAGSGFLVRARLPFDPESDRT